MRQKDSGNVSLFLDLDDLEAFEPKHHLTMADVTWGDAIGRSEFLDSFVDSKAFAWAAFARVQYLLLQ